MLALVMKLREFGDGPFFALWLSAALVSAALIVYCWRRFGPSDW